jgi:adenylate/nucleoside-diphosphate kinase
MKVTTANMKFINAERLKAQLQFLRDKLRGIIEDDKVINIEKYMSRSKVLPRDTDNPFEDDILEYAKQTPLQLLIIGRPKCGKTTLAKKIAAKYGIVHVSMESSVNKIFERVKFFEENPPEVDDNGIPKDGLTPIEKCIIEDLSLGKTVDPGDLLDILNEEMKNPATASKGFILDLPLDYPSKTNWVDLIINNKLHTPKINCRYFSHVIELEQTDEEWKYFLKAVMEKG